LDCGFDDNKAAAVPSFPSAVFFDFFADSFAAVAAVVAEASARSKAVALLTKKFTIREGFGWASEVIPKNSCLRPKSSLRSRTGLQKFGFASKSTGVGKAFNWRYTAWTRSVESRNFEGSSLSEINGRSSIVPWAGVSTAPRGEVGTLLSQERDVMEENVTS